MSDLQEQIAFLRRRIAAVAERTPSPPAAPLPNEPLPPGCLAGTASGAHWQAERLFASHGSTRLAGLLELPADLFAGISDGAVPAAEPSGWLFLDTETTGLAGGSGTLAFLIGVGRLTPQGMQVRQFFLRDPCDEPSALEALAAELASASVLITYNGKAFDVPLLETRFRMCRRRPPFSSIPHLDLLHPARRLWRLRYASCRLADLERDVLGCGREDDVPGELIPRIYFDYLRTQRAARLAAVFHHNAVDIVALACLAAVVPWAFRDPVSAPLAHGAEMISLGRWLRAAGRLEQAVTLLRRGLERPVSDELTFRTLWDVAGLEKKLGRVDAALALYAELASCRNPHRVAALEQLAMHHEHRARNLAAALECTEAALRLADSGPLRRRRLRLLRRAATVA